MKQTLPTNRLKHFLILLLLSLFLLQAYPYSLWADQVPGQMEPQAQKTWDRDEAKIEEKFQQGKDWLEEQGAWFQEQGKLLNEAWAKSLEIIRTQIEQLFAKVRGELDDLLQRNYTTMEVPTKSPLTTTNQG